MTLPMPRSRIGGDKGGCKSSFYERKAAMAVLEFKPNDNVQHGAGCLPLGLQRIADHPAHGVRHGLGQHHDDDSWMRVPSRTGVSSRARSTDVPFLVIENYNNDRDAKVDSIGLNTKFTFSDNWSCKADCELVQRRSSRSAPGIDGGQRYWCRSGRARPSGDGHHLLHHPAEWPHATSRRRSTTATTTMYSWLIRATGAAAFAARASSGIRRSTTRSRPSASRRTASSRASSAKWASASTTPIARSRSGSSRATCTTRQRLDGRARAVSDRYRQDARSSAARMASSVTTRWRCGGMASGSRSTRSTIRTRTTVTAVYNVTNTWDVNEKLTTAYVKLGIDTELGQLPLRGNFGVQAVHGGSDVQTAQNERDRSAKYARLGHPGHR